MKAELNEYRTMLILTADTQDEYDALKLWMSGDASDRANGIVRRGTLLRPPRFEMAPPEKGGSE